jgi:hypothetical protein
MRKLVRPKPSLGHQAEHIWKTWQASLFLGIMCGAAALWAIWRIPSPGVSIAILGGVAAIMSLRPEARLAEKAGWLVIVTVLLVAEVESIKRNETQNFNDRKDQIGRLTALTASSNDISAKIEKFAPRSVEVASAPTAIHPPTPKGAHSPAPITPNDDHQLVEDLKGIVDAHKWGLSQEQLVTLSRLMSAFTTSNDRGDLITVEMNDPDSQRFGNQLVGAFRAAG